MIVARDLLVRLPGRVLRLPDFDVHDGERLAVVGPNGSGKTTLLRALAGFAPIASGSLDGVPAPGRAVLVHQQPYMLIGTAAHNVAFALRRAGRPAADAERWLAALGAEELAARPARLLSTGEQRRVALARALAVDPELLLLDEPLTGLDDAGSRSLQSALDAFRGTLVVATPEAGLIAVQRELVLAAC